MEENKMEKQTEETLPESEVQKENESGSVGKSIKSFFKKVKGALEKLDKKLDETMENDPYAKKEQKDSDDKEV